MWIASWKTSSGGRREDGRNHVTVERQMERKFYLKLAASGLRMPIGTDLVLREQADPEGVMHDGAALGRVVADAARRYRTPLAVPLMDLRLEKADLLRLLGFEESLVDTFHFDEAPSE
jgi:hypothetical protein